MVNPVYLLDTSIVSAPAAARPDPALVGLLERRARQCVIAAPVWHELEFGWQRLPPGRRRDLIAAYLHEVVHAALPILPYDEPAAAWHAQERARLESAGRPVPLADSQIAAIAVTRGLVLVTTNEKDFAVFRDLTVENWARRG